jgi:hypothetical protein
MGLPNDLYPRQKAGGSRRSNPGNGFQNGLPRAGISLLDTTFLRREVVRRVQAVVRAEITPLKTGY